MRKPLLSLTAVTVAVLLWGKPTEAATITFSGLLGPNGAPFLSYSEADFTVTGGGGFVEALVFGNPVPDLSVTSVRRLAVSRCNAQPAGTSHSTR